MKKLLVCFCATFLIMIPFLFTPSISVKANDAESSEKSFGERLDDALQGASGVNGQMEYIWITDDLQYPTQKEEDGYYYTGFDTSADGKSHVYDIVRIFESPTVTNIAKFVQKVSALFIVLNVIIYFVFMQGNEKGQALIKKVIIAWLVLFVFFGARMVIANTLQEVVDIFANQQTTQTDMDISK